MREYETLYILRSDASDERVDKVREKVAKTVEAHQGSVLGFDDWGSRRMAYEIQKDGRGRMILAGYCAPGAAIVELERELRYDDVVIRFTTRRLGDQPDVEASKKLFTERLGRFSKEPTTAPPPEDDDRGDRRPRRSEGRYEGRFEGRSDERSRPEVNDAE